MRAKLFLLFKYWLHKKTHPCREPKEIYDKMEEHHSLYLKYDREMKEGKAAIEKIRRDALRWVLKWPEEKQK